MSFSQLTEEQLGALQEMSRIGMAHAATALSQLMSKSILLEVPRFLAIDVEQLPAILGETKPMAVGVCLQILGDIRGNILIGFSRENAMRMLDCLLSRDKPGATLLTELEISALREVGNILASAYLSALGELFKMTLIPSVPVLSFDMAGAAWELALTKRSETGDLSFMIETVFSEDGNNFSGHFFLLPDHASLEIIMGKIMN